MSKTAGSKISVVICDDQPLIVSSLQLILETDPDIQVVSTASDGAQALDIIAALAPDVVLMDIQMPHVDGISATQKITAEHDTKVIVLTTFNRDDYLFDALDAGASGFLLKNTDPETLINAVHQVAAGYGLLSPEVTLKLIEHRTGQRTGMRTTPNDPDTEADDPVQSLTEREKQVLVELARGKNNSEIAAVLDISEATIKSHVSNLLAKLHLRDRVQAVLFAHRIGLIQ